MRSWLEQLVESGTPLPEAMPEPANYVRIFDGDRDPDRQEALERRLAVVRDREQHPNEGWGVLAMRHHVTEDAARYYWRRYRGEQGSRETGEGAVIPGRSADGMRAPQAYLDRLREIYASPKRLSVAQTMKHRSSADTASDRCISRRRPYG